MYGVSKAQDDLKVVIKIKFSNILTFFKTQHDHKLKYILRFVPTKKYVFVMKNR